VTIRFHLDEHLSHSIADGLRRREIDVTTTAEVGLLGASDDEQLSFASREHRVMVTEDEDFFAVASRIPNHAGIVFLAKGSKDIGRVVRRLSIMHDAMTSEQLQGKIEFA
jgi:predicted nuclease of predicted toxin-antitoxin system